MKIIDGKEYRVVKVPPGEYLTRGHVYRATVYADSIGLHRANGGCGTYVKRRAIELGRVILERV